MDSLTAERQEMVTTLMAVSDTHTDRQTHTHTHTYYLALRVEDEVRLRPGPSLSNGVADAKAAQR